MPTSNVASDQTKTQQNAAEACEVIHAFIAVNEQKHGQLISEHLHCHGKPGTCQVLSCDLTGACQAVSQFPVCTIEKFKSRRNITWNLHRSINFCLPPCSIPKLTRRSTFCLPLASERFLTIRAEIQFGRVFFFPMVKLPPKRAHKCAKQAQNERKSALEKRKRAQIQQMLRIAGSKLHLRGCLEHFLLKRVEQKYFVAKIKVAMEAPGRECRHSVGD